MKHILVASFIIVFGFLPLVAQEPKLKGKVISAEKPPPKLWGDIRITVKNRANNQEVTGELKVTKDQDWYHGAPLGAYVDVLFDKGCYVPDGIYNVNVRPGESLQDTVQLQRLKECLILDRRQTRTRYKRNASIRANLEVTGIFGVTIRGAIEASASLTVDSARDKTAALDTELLPSVATLERQLEKEAKFAREGGFQDTFEYNFFVKQRAYAEVPELMNVLSRFKNDAQNADLFKQVGEIKPEMFDDVIRAQFEIPGEVNLDYIKKIIKDEALGPSVRGSATVALLNLKLDDNSRNEFREYFRRQDQNSPIFTTALVARARLGDATLYEDIRNSKDSTLITASMQAIATAKIIEGPGAWPEGSQTLADVANKSEDPVLRAFAFASLRPFAYRSDRIAIDTLIQGVRRDPDAAARFRAAVSLGVGDLEDTGAVRRVLMRVARTDSSSDVRRAANFSLSGAKWMNSPR